MTVEILFPEVCNYYGDPQNGEYLKASCPDAEFIKTALTDEPYFVKNTPDIILMGSMSENYQRIVIDKLLPFKARLEELCNMGRVMLFTGNAADIFCRRINYVSENIEKEALGFFDIDVKTDWFHRVNGKIIGDADGQTLTGFRSQFAEYSGDNSAFAFIKCERGFGTKPGSVYEGMRRNNLICTQVLGPILPLNPCFTEYILKLAGFECKAAFRTEAFEAYNQRVKEFRDPDTKF